MDWDRTWRVSIIGNLVFSSVKVSRSIPCEEGI